MFMSESICTYADAIFKQLRIRQIGSLHVAIHASSEGGGGLSQHLSRRANINPALCQSLVFAGMAQ